MKKLRVKFLLLLIVVFSAGCGSGRKLAENPQILGYVPFISENMAGLQPDLNHTLPSALEGSGSFIIYSLDSIPSIWDLNRMKTSEDSLVQWIITGEFVYENQKINKGRKIPFLFYTPSAAVSVKLRYRLFSREKGGWQDIGEIKAEEKKSGDLQFAEYNASDPSLVLNAKERQLLREKTYQQLAQKLVEQLEKQMKIN